MDFWNYLWQNLRLATVMDVLDILIMSVLIYKVIIWIRHTAAERLLRGVFLLLVVMQVSDFLKLHMINFVIDKAMQLGALALLIVFQPELRKMLERFGRSKLQFFRDKKIDRKSMEMVIFQTVEAVSAMSWSKTGVLIVFSRNDNLSSIMHTGTEIDAQVSSELLKNIFFLNSPLHDGAVVISEGRVSAAGCLLPLSSNLNISKELGTRHRAALGVTEESDCVCVIVSEETGAISFASGGILKRHLAPETLERLLINHLTPDKEETGGLQSFKLWLRRKTNHE